MAIKGKRKSQNRGSQARRRPATAPRPPVGARRKPPWYRTTSGQVIASLVFLVVVVGVIAIVAHVRNNSKTQTATQNQLETYTAQIRSVLVKLTPPASEMAAAPTSSTDPGAIKALKRSTTDWAKTFETELSEIQQITPAVGSTSAAQVFTQSIQLYSTAVQTFKLVPDASSDQQDQLLGQAQAELAQAGGLWTLAVGLLDQARDDVGLPASRLRSPQGSLANSSTPAPQQSTFSIPAGSGSGGGSGKKSGSSKSGKGGK